MCPKKVTKMWFSWASRMRACKNNKNLEKHQKHELREQQEHKFGREGRMQPETWANETHTQLFKKRGTWVG